MAKTKALGAPTMTPSLNDHGPPMERHYAWVPIEGYDGFEVHCWSNATQKVMIAVDSEDSDAVQQALLQLVIGVRTVHKTDAGEKTYDAWFDCDGDPFPEVDDPAFYDALPMELYILLRRAIRLAMVALPNLLARTRGR